MAKVNRLRKMKIAEVSLVDHPASIGANVVLMKRAAPGGVALFDDVRKARPKLFDDVRKDDDGDDVEPDDDADDEEEMDKRGPVLFDDVGKPRGPQTFDQILKYNHNHDAEGKFTTADGAAPSTSDKVRAVGRVVRDHVKNALAAGGSIAVSTRLRRANPVTGGGVQFGVSAKTRNGDKLLANVQVHPEDFGEEVGVGHRTLDALHRSLKVLGHPEVARSETRLTVRRYREGVLAPTAPLSLGQTDPTATATSSPASGQTQGWSGMGGRVSTPGTVITSRPASTGTGPVAQTTVESVSSRPEPTKVRDDLVVTTPYHVDEAKTPDTAGGHAFYTAGGEFVPRIKNDPGGQYQRQIYNHVTTATAAEIDALPVATYATSGGKAYLTQRQAFVPAAPPDVQRHIEAVYGNEHTRMKLAPRKGEPDAVTAAQVRRETAMSGPSEAEIQAVLANGGAFPGTETLAERARRTGEVPAISKLAERLRKDFDEVKHPRGRGGLFTSSGSASSDASPKGLSRALAEKIATNVKAGKQSAVAMIKPQPGETKTVFVARMLGTVAGMILDAQNIGTTPASDLGGASGEYLGHMADRLKNRVRKAADDERKRKLAAEILSDIYDHRSAARAA